MRKEGFITYKVKQDAHLKQLSSTQYAKLKGKRSTLKLKTQVVRAKTERARKTKRNNQTLSKRQLRIRNKRQERLNRQRAKLKYKKGGGDIAFRNIMDEGNWQENFVSTNVWRYRRRGDNLLIQFLDGSVYMYFGVAKQFIGLKNVGSKGKWVWRRLIRAGIKYLKLR